MPVLFTKQSDSESGIKKNGILPIEVSTITTLNDYHYTSEKGILGVRLMPCNDVVMYIYIYITVVYSHCISLITPL